MIRRLFDFLVGGVDQIDVLPPELQRRLDRDDDLRATEARLTRELGRSPSATELWAASPPPVEVLGVE